MYMRLASSSSLRSLRSLFAVLALALPAAAMRPAARASRRAVVLQGVACAACSVGLSRPASASLAVDLKEATEAYKASTGGQSTDTALERLLTISEDYGGMPTDQLRKEVVELMRKKRDALRSAGKEQWGGVEEEAYQRVMRVVDPWRVVELQPIAQVSVLAFVPVYAALLGVQQFVPKLFAPAYALGAVLVFGPLVLQLAFG